jgi:N-terminal domain of galactosyltransferase/N-terminal region of glycosyl transferase group 7
VPAVTQRPALVVPYANRADYLRVFLELVPRYLEIENGLTDYLIVVSEQVDGGPFSASTARNVGALHALSEAVTHLVFNDVDMIPVAGVDYRHRDRSTICFQNFGGCKILSSDFLAVNGYNSHIAGWGFEDSEFYDRLETFDLDAERWDRSAEAETAVVMDLELGAASPDEARAHTRWYWRRTHDRGPSFVGCPRPLTRYDRSLGWYSQETKERNLLYANGIYNRYPKARRSYYLAHGISSIALETSEVTRDGKIWHVKFERHRVMELAKREE